MGVVKTTFTSEDKDVQKALERLHKQNVKLVEDMKALKAANRSAAMEAKKSGDDYKRMFDSAIGSVAKLATGYLSLQGAISTVRAEYDALLQRQDKAANTQVSLAKLQQQAFRNLGDDSDVTNAKQLQELVDRVIEKSGALPRDAWAAMTDALSARGDRTATQAADAVAAALRVAPFSPEDVPVLAGSALDVGKAANLDPESALGFILGIGSKARVTNLQNLATATAPGALDLMKFGDDLSSAGAIVATMTQGMNDPEGRSARTASIALAQQLEKMTTALGRDDLTSTEQRIRAVQEDPALRSLFMEGGTATSVSGGEVRVTPASFEKKAFAAVRELLSGDEQSSLVRNLAQADRELAAIDPRQKYETVIRDQEGFGAVAAARAQRAFESTTAQIQGANPEAISAVIREGLSELRSSFDNTAIENNARKYIDDILNNGRPTLQTAIEGVTQLRDEIPRRRTGVSIMNLVNENNPFVNERERVVRRRQINTVRVNEAEQTQLAATNKLLEQLIALQREQNDKIEQANRKREADGRDRAAAGALRNAQGAR